MRDVLAWLVRLGRADSPLPWLGIGAAVMFAIQLDREIHDVDIFWQVKLGILTLMQGLPSHEPFLAGQDATPLVPLCWLGQVLYAGVWTLGGWPLLRLADAAIWFGGFLLVAWFFARRLNNDWPALAGLFVGWYAAIPHASLRPQSLAVLCFGLLIVLVRCELSNRKKLIAGALLLVIWQNLHPSVMIGVAYLGATAAVLWIESLLRKARPPWTESVLFVVAAVATVLTPAGTEIFAVSKYNEEISKARGITEWLPMWGADWFGWKDYGRDHAWISLTIVAVIVPFALGLSILTGRRRIRAADFVVLLGLTAASLFMHRFILFWAVAVIPVVAEALALPSEHTPRNRWRCPLVVLAMLIAIVPPMTARPAPFTSYYPFPAVAALKQSGFRGVIYSNYFWGGIIAEAGHPEWKVTHDGRYYLFTREDWKLYDDARAGRVPLEVLLDTHHPDAFFLWKEGHDEPLIAKIRDRWPVLYEDSQAVIFRRPQP